MDVLDLKKQLDAIPSALGLWLNCVKSPVSTAKDILTSTTSDTDKLTKTIAIWTTAFLISVIVQLPLYHSVGVDWQLSFHLPNAVITVLGLFCLVAGIHLILTLRGIPSRFTDTFVMYTVIVGAFSPIVALLNYPALIKLFHWLQSIKLVGVTTTSNLIESAYSAMQLSRTGIADTLFALLGQYGQVFSMFLLVIFGRELADWYGCDKIKCFESMATGMLITMPALALLSILSYYALYVFIK